MSTPTSTSSARNEVRRAVPRLIEVSETLLYPDVSQPRRRAHHARGVLPAAMTAAKHVVEEAGR